MKKFWCTFVFFILIFCSVLNAENKVLEFSAEVKGSSVFLSWKTTPHKSSLLLYRGLNPFTKLSSLVDSVLLSTFSNSTETFIDNPPANTNYYYALIFVDEITSDKELEFISGKNSILNPIRIATEFTDTPIADREISLPLLNVDEKVKSPAVIFSTETETKINELENRFGKYNDYIAQLKTSENIEFFRFQNEASLTADVNSLSLKRILDINEKKWSKLEKALKEFLTLSHTEEITSRAYFYLGEAYFFQNKFDKALLTFLQLEDTFEKEAKIWIMASLDKLGEKQK